MKILLRFPSVILVLLLTFPVFSQDFQTVKGRVLDRQSEQPLTGVTVEVSDTDPSLGAVTDIDGRFVLTRVPLGRHAIRLRYLGYETLTIPNVLVNAGKEVVLNLSMEESVVRMNEVVVKANKNRKEVNNEMATVSARTLDLEQVNRFSGGRNDLARLAGNFAGVAVADDSRNDLVIRGNSPTGVLWRLEGVPIPNPNHFATLGTTGGPVSALNPNLLRSSDFLTSAFPAEYGNALAGVFDLGFRNGNRDKFEFTAQLAAFSGLEAMAEGPLSEKKNSSFLVSYRHSFVEIADELGIPIGTNATPNYRDLSFKLDFANGNAGKFSLFGIGASSDIDFLGDELDEDDLFAEPDEDAFFRSRLGVIGLRHNIIVGDDAYLRTVISATAAEGNYDQDEIPDGGQEKIRVIESDNLETTYNFSSYFNKKFSPRLTLRTGVLAQIFGLETDVRDRENRPDADDDGQPDWATVSDFNGHLGLLQAFAQSQYRPGSDWTINLGVHAQYLEFNDAFALEPRLAVNWDFRSNQRLNFGYGLHHQLQPLPVFFFTEEVADGQFVATNQDLDFTRSHHFVLGYNRSLGASWKAKLETYYQAIRNVPVQQTPTSFSMLNAGDDFTFPEVGSLVNEGIGANYGLELTLEKAFTKGYYAMLTTSVFDSEYEGSDGIRRNTAFNNGYVLNLLSGKEFKVGENDRNALTLDMKLTTAGGRNFTPIDLAASRQTGEEILIEESAYSERYDPYFRFDVKFGIQLNSRSSALSHQFFLDLQNVTGNENIFVRRFSESTGEINEVLQSGFFPDLLYRVQF